MGPVAVGKQAPDLVFFDGDEREVRLSGLWAQGPLVAVFLRHFG